MAAGAGEGATVRGAQVATELALQARGDDGGDQADEQGDGEGEQEMSARGAPSDGARRLGRGWGGGGGGHAETRRRRARSPLSALPPRARRAAAHETMPSSRRFVKRVD